VVVYWVARVGNSAGVGGGRLDRVDLRECPLLGGVVVAGEDQVAYLPLAGNIDNVVGHVGGQLVGQRGVDLVPAGALEVAQHGGLKLVGADVSVADGGHLNSEAGADADKRSASAARVVAAAR
jgi:hypothetical protein